MPTDQKQKKAFEFFLEHFKTGQPFTKQELEDATDWHGTTFTTNWSKWFRPFTAPLKDDKFRVTEWFRRFQTWESFKRHTSQTRPTAADYREFQHDIVRIYEFFMPLTNEPHLRSALDGLFYEDTFRQRLLGVEPGELEGCFPPEGLVDDSSPLDRALVLIAKRFLGYSIYQVNGRFRAESLKTQSEVGNDIRSYLADETTAVTRFIFPCSSDGEAKQVDFLFTKLFVKTILEAVNAEDEIWMVETGYNERLRVWKVPDEDEA